MVITSDYVISLKAEGMTFSASVASEDARHLDQTMNKRSVLSVDIVIQTYIFFGKFYSFYKISKVLKLSLLIAD